MAIKRSRRISGIITNTPIFLFILSCFCIIMEPFSSHAVGDTITKDQNVTLWDPLISSNGNFKLGFFKPGRSDNYFLGIWYNKSPEIKPVWVANRNSPIYDTSGALAITDDGILYITYGSNFIVLNSNQGATFDNLTAKLLDSGNFVLSREVSSSKGSDVLWQSFDYPTDTILDGMKVGLNLKTGQTWSLTSWLSYSAPAPGAFTLGIDPNGTKQLVLWQRGEVISTSGIWHNGSFPEDYNNYFWRNDWRTSDSIYNISYVSTVDEEYFTFSLYKNYYYSGYSSSSIIMGMLDPWGQFSTQVLEEGANFYTWGNNPEIIGSCKEGNAYNYHNDGVCMVHKRLDCSSSPNEEFSLAKGFFGGIASLDLNLGISDCHAKCRSNCSCIAYSSFYDNGTGCVFWYKELGFTTSAESGYGFDVYALTGLLEDQGNDGTGGGNGLPTLNSTSGAGREKKKQRPAMQSTKTWWWLWSIMAVAPVVTVLLFGSLCYLQRYFKLKGEKKTIQKKFLLELGTNINMNKIGKEGKKGDELQIFSFNSITSATANFSSTNKLGEGGFGPVYKGKLLEGQEIAVKRLSRSSGQGQEEFKNEIVLIAKLQHMNLVRLLGCCIHVDEKMLIYEYMPNNSLDVYLFDPTKKKLLDWKRRLNIIEGIAQGLLYLHKFSRLRVIHRDLKASNILLDAEMNPKISDFGMARIFGRNESEANTNRVVGTYGYMSPEYAMEGIFSVKSDAYSFGVLLLEIISGRKNTGSYHPDRPISLIGYAWDLWKESKGLELMDPILSDSCPIDDLLRCTHVGLLCVQEMANDRPTMSDVISMLTNETFPRPAPKQPAFYLGRNVIKDGLPKDESKNCSINDVSISIIEAR